MMVIMLESQKFVLMTPQRERNLYHLRKCVRGRGQPQHGHLDKLKERVSYYVSIY